MPGAMVALLEDQRVLLTKRTDDGTWCLPAGAAEPGGSFARTAIDELAEETGIKADSGHGHYVPAAQAPATSSISINEYGL
jgi:8-oxo-dGTP pyrophosphatase MutT (NUDIX family)